MPEKQKFMPHDELLDYTEISLLVDRFIAHGIRKVRLTGGEPLVRRDIDVLINALGNHVRADRLDELTMTTNGSLLAEHAPMLAAAGIKRINVSLDSLDPEKFAQITRRGNLQQVLAGIAAAKANNIQVKINMVALRNQNEADVLPMAKMCADNGFDLSIIETMPLGEGMASRQDDYIALEEFIAPLRLENKLHTIPHRTSGPARYWQVDPLNLRLGLITPMSNNFCDNCNRLRLTTDGKIYMCLGSQMHVDFKQAIRNGGLGAVDRLLQNALRLKPERHDFEKQLKNPNMRLDRHMNATGG